MIRILVFFFFSFLPLKKRIVSGKIDIDMNYINFND